MLHISNLFHKYNVAEYANILCASNAEWIKFYEYCFGTNLNI